MKEIPSSVYRLQLNEKFNLKQATALLPFLKSLGIEGVYCSPYFSAYSPHGYDIINPNKINPQVATLKDYQNFCKKMKALGLYHIADIVPNHMGIKGGNEWWLDVLKNGKKSKYAPFFDIDWSQEKIMIPILGETYEEALEKGKFQIFSQKGKMWVKYSDQYFPIKDNRINLPKTTKEIDKLLQRQHYRLVHHLKSAEETSYRRFFNINELIGICIEKEKVLKTHHQWIFKLLRTKQVNGLRIDHPDGLYDPKGYFDALRKKTKGLILVEKILGWGEEIPANWQVDGTVGYEFMNMLTGIFVKKNPKLTDVYFNFIGKKLDFEDLLYQKKKYYLLTEMSGDVKTLCRKLKSFSSFSQEELFATIAELLTTFPIYRSYIRPKGKVSEADAMYFKEAFAKARVRNPNLNPQFDFLEKIFNLEIDNAKIRDFILRFQQLSAPIMAKGFEDITLYNYNRLLALNEVGSSPERQGVTVEEFHAFCQRKQEKWPLGFLSTSTHDTKRSQDVRMQLAVLSEIPEKWEKALQEWSKLNRSHKTSVDQQQFPDPNAEYFLYQILLGAWPSRPSFQRMWGSFQKSIREAREFTSWRHPDLIYENACEKFLKAILKKESPFLQSFEKFQKEIMTYGEWNSLSANAIKLGAPGIVELYQGCENWRYMLVDPDNRNPVDYRKPRTLKVDLHERALHFRKVHKDLFLKGKYHPLTIRGNHRENIVAYLRTFHHKNCLVAGVRFFSKLQDLNNTQILLPKNIQKGTEVFSGKQFKGKEIEAEQLFKNVPFGWIFWEERGSTKGRLS